MPAFTAKKMLVVPLAMLAVAGLFTVTMHRSPVDFSAEVKPILNKKCISCHGGVKKQGNFSVLFRSEALAKTKSGKWGIVPGDAQHSEMIRRIRSKDPEERMPYQHAPLSEQEIKTLTNWVEQGAPWGDHWAFTSLKPVQVPVPSGALFGLIPGRKWDWVQNDIDRFIYQKIKEQHLTPSPEADKATLLRRVALDLTGLPASSSLAEKYLASNQPQAYGQLVDSLLASPHYGERWAAVWLDIARYADTKGYERDAGRTSGATATG